MCKKGRVSRCAADVGGKRSEAELGAEPGRVKDPSTLPTEYVKSKKAQKK